MGVATISARAAFTGSTSSFGPELIVLSRGDTAEADATGRMDVKEAGTAVELDAGAEARGDIALDVTDVTAD